MKPTTSTNPIATVTFYIEHLKMRKLSQNTIQATSSDLSQVEQFTGRPLVTTTEADLRAYFRASAHLKASTIRRRITTLRGFFAFADRFKAIDEDPTGNIEMPKLPQRLPIHLQQSEVQRLLHDLPQDTAIQVRDAALVRLLFYTGMRAGEVIRLDVSDVDWEERQIRVIGKGDKERLIPISAKLAEALAEWLKARELEAHSQALFITLGGRIKGVRLSHDAVLVAVRGCFEAVGIPPKKYSPHKLRHTCATELLRKGVPIEQISQILGHAKLDTTLIYAHTEPTKLRVALEQLG